MFTGIVEATGYIRKISRDEGNIHLTIECQFTNELKIDQSVSHNGVCLTVTNISGNLYTVTLIEETLNRSNFSSLTTGDEINLERSLKATDRLDGHIVQGHVDTVATIDMIRDENGSKVIYLTYKSDNITVEKGSICMNGVSLTVVDSGRNHFSVAIIPYTWEHTNFRNLKVGDLVNLEFDIIGKYISKILSMR